MMGFQTLKSIPLVLAVCMSALAGCMEPTVLEYEFLLAPKVEEVSRDGGLFLRVDGYCGHSALAVDKTVSEKKIDGLHIYTHLVLVRESRRSGALEYIVAVPDDVRRVYFGRKERLIWERK